MEKIFDLLMYPWSFWITMLNSYPYVTGTIFVVSTYLLWALHERAGKLNTLGRVIYFFLFVLIIPPLAITLIYFVISGNIGGGCFGLHPLC